MTPDEVKVIAENVVLEAAPQIQEMVEEFLLQALPQLKDKIEESLPEQLPEQTLTFVRHGSTALNEDGDKIRGHLDVPLSPLGIEQGKNTAEKLKGRRINGIIHSDLIRSKKTAEIISEITGVPIIGSSFNLRPWHVGKFTGVESKIAVPQLMEYINDPDKVVPGGESFNAFKIRFLDEIRRIWNAYPDQNIAVVSHHRNERVLAGWIKYGMRDDYSNCAHCMGLKGIPPAAFKEYQNFFPGKKVEPVKGDPGYTPMKGVDYNDGKDADETAITLNVLSRIPKLNLDEIARHVIAMLPPEIEETPEELRDRLLTLEDAWLPASKIVGLPAAVGRHVPMHGGGDTLRYVDLSSQLNGVLKTFTLTRVNRVLGVFCTQFPINLAPIGDWTFDNTTGILTLGASVSAPAANQALWVLYVEG